MTRAARAALFVACALIGQPSTADLLDVPLRAQAGPRWCWAAAAEMVHDYLRDGTAADVGQCSLARRVLTLGSLGCQCCPPDAYRRQEECDRATPFEAPFVPRILQEEGISSQTVTPERALTPEALTCQVESRERPLIFWWRYGATCHNEGHLAVVMGTDGSTGTRLFAALDPAPVEQGDRAWLTYPGFACGPSGGHCTDYFGFRTDGAGERAPCRAAASPDCREGTHDSVAAALAEVERWLNADAADQIYRHLELAPPAGKVKCFDALRVQEAVPAARPATARKLATEATRRSRFFCLRPDGAERPWISVQLFETTSGAYFVSRFGQQALSDELLSALETLLPRFGSVTRWLMDEERVRGLELEEVFLPGLGSWLLVLRDGPRERVVPIGFGVERVFDGRTVLELPLRDGLTLGQWMDDWARRAAGPEEGAG